MGDSIMVTKKKISKSPAKKPLRDYWGMDPKYHSYKNYIGYSPTLFTKGRVDTSILIPYSFGSKNNIVPREWGRVNAIKIARKIATKPSRLYDHNNNQINKKDVRSHRYYVMTVPYKTALNIENKASERAKEYLDERPDLKDDWWYVWQDMDNKELAKIARHRRITRKNKSPIERR